MRILYIRNEINTMMNQWQNFYIINELNQSGIEVVKFSPVRYESIDEANEELLRICKNETYDLLINVYNEKTVYLDTVMEIRQHGIPTVLICFDNLVIPYEHRIACKYYDCVWITSKENENKFKGWGANTIFLPYAASPDVCRPVNKENINRICFVGSPYGARVDLINGFIDKNLPIDIYYDKASGNPFDKVKNRKSAFKSVFEMSKSNIGRKLLYSTFLLQCQKPKLHDTDDVDLRKYPSVTIEKLGEIYSNYTLSLSSTSARNTELLKNNVPIVNLRSFEIPMAGGVEFCRYNEELSEYFEEGKEILFYRSDDEKKEKADYYLNPAHISEVNEIKRNARLRAVREHTWMNRFQKLFDKMNLRT